MRSFTIFVLFGTSLNCIAQQPLFKITTMAGAPHLSEDTPAENALLNTPSGLAVDRQGNLFVADAENNVIRRISPEGRIFTIAGTGGRGFSGDGGPAKQAKLNSPLAVAVDIDGSILIADSGNVRIRRVSSDGTIRTIAGSIRGFAGDGGPAIAARITSVTGLCVDIQGNIYMSDTQNHRIRKIDRSGRITTAAGGIGAVPTELGVPAERAVLSFPTGLTLASDGSLYFANYGTLRIMRLTQDGVVSVFAGSGQYRGIELNDQSRLGAGISNPRGVLAVGNVLYLTDTSRLMKIEDGRLSTIAGTTQPRYGIPQIAMAGQLAASPDGGVLLSDEVNHAVYKYRDGRLQRVAGATHASGDGGPAVSAQLFGPTDAVLDDSTGSLFVSDALNYRVRMISPDGRISTRAGNGIPGVPEAQNTSPNQSIPRVNALAISPDGSLLLGAGSMVLQLTKAGVLSRLAGSNMSGFRGDGGPALDALLCNALDLAVDPKGKVYIADQCNSRVRALSDGRISTVAGGGPSFGSFFFFVGEGKQATEATLPLPSAVMVDKDGNLLIADGLGAVRKVAQSGIISTVDPTNRGTAFGIASDKDGNLLIADTQQHRVLLRTPSGAIRVLAGTGEAGFGGDNGVATSALLSSPRSVVPDGKGNYIIVDTGNHRVRVLSPIRVARLEKVSGDMQTGRVGSRAASPLTVRVRSEEGIPIPNILVQFAIASGAGSLDKLSASTGGDGTASVAITFGSNPGEVRIIASTPGAPSAEFNLTATLDGAPVEQIPTISGVFSTGPSAGRLNRVARNLLVDIVGEDLAPTGVAASADLEATSLPTQLAGTCIVFGGKQAPLISVAPDRVRLVIPDAGESEDVEVRAITRCGSNDPERRSEALLVRIAPAAPELITSGSVEESGYLLIPDEVRPGDLIDLQAIGLGVTDPAYPVGQRVESELPTFHPVTVVLDDTEVSAESAVQAVGISGLYRIRVALPPDLRAGEVRVKLRVAGAETPAGGFIKVSPAP